MDERCGESGLVSLEMSRPEWLAALVLVPAWWWWVRPDLLQSLLVARCDAAGPLSLSGWRAHLIEHLPNGLRAAAITCLILFLTQPQTVRIHEEREAQSVGIAFAIDLSTSMWAGDMADRMTRLQVAKATVRRFLENRSDDVGLVSFAGEALTRLPLTHDTYVVDAAVEALEVGLLIDGTDVAGAVAAGAGLLRDTPHPSKVLILVTDGAHNRAGLIPSLAARAASAFGVKVYPIAIGNQANEAATAGMETVLTQAARITGGRYFRATDEAALDSIYAEIDRLVLSTDELAERTERTPVGPWLLLGALALLLGATSLRASRWGLVP